jgi:hypothetical protein
MVITLVPSMLKGRLVTPFGVSIPVAKAAGAARTAAHINAPNNVAQILDVERKGICAS